MSTDTKTRILDAAEMRFAEHGYSATSLRDITTLAAANLASVNYHFGSKEALLEAVFQRRVVPVNDARLRRLDLAESQAGDGPLGIEPIVRAFLAPAFETAQESGLREPKFMQLVGRMHSETNSEFRDVFLRLFVEVGKRFGAALRRARPDLEAEEVMWRLHFMIGSLAHTLVWEQCCDEVMAPPAQDHDALLDGLTRYAVAGMSAAGPRGSGAPAATKSSHSGHGRVTGRPSLVDEPA
jgi:AcrR family transcriptional regulator